MDDMNGLPGNVVFANVISWLMALFVLAGVWFCFILLFGPWIGGFVGWLPGVILAVGVRIVMFFCLEMVEDVFTASRSALPKVLDRVPEKHWKWWLMGLMLGPTAIIAAAFAMMDALSRP